jgi:hypothetical protein
MAQEARQPVQPEINLLYYSDVATQERAAMAHEDSSHAQ